MQGWCCGIPSSTQRFGLTRIHMPAPALGPLPSLPSAPQLESLPVLLGMLAAFQQWEAVLRGALQDLSGAPLKPSFAALQGASLAAKAWPITSPLRAYVDTAVANTGAPEQRWLHARCVLACSSTVCSALPCVPAAAPSQHRAAFLPACSSPHAPHNPPSSPHPFPINPVQGTGPSGAARCLPSETRGPAWTAVWRRWAARWTRLWSSLSGAWM